MIFPMAPKNKCPRCSHKCVEPRVIRDEFDYGPDDDRIKIVAEAVPVLVCTACDEIFYGPEAGHAHHLAICKALHLLTPEEIKGVRDRLGKNQAEFARLTGVGVATLSRWEQGRLMQTRAHDNYLKLLLALPEAIGVLARIDSLRSGIASDGVVADI